MTKNLMLQIAKLLGVEIGEEFKIRRPDYEVCENGIYAFFENEGLMKKNEQGEFDNNSSIEFEDLCLGNYEIIKIPWEPKEGDRYCAMGITDATIPYITWYTWGGYIVDYARLKLGLIYRTEKEADAHMAKDYEKLTGKNLQKYLEWLQEEAKKYG